MERNRKIQIYCLLVASLFLSLFGAVCLYMGIASEYNDAMGHFAVNSIFAPCAYLCIGAGPLLGIVGWISFRGHASGDRSPWAPVPAKVACIVAAALVLVSALLEISANEPVPRGAGGILNASRIFAFLTVLSLAVNALFSKRGPAKPVVSLLSFAPVLYCALKVMFMYFDQSVAVNSPVKFICQLIYLSYMLVFTAQTGLSLGRGEVFPRYIFTLCAAVAIGGAGSIASLAVKLADVPCAAISQYDFFSQIGLFIYSCTLFALTVHSRLERIEKAKKNAAKKDSDKDND